VSLSPEIRELASTLQLDTKATIRSDFARATRAVELDASLPRVTLGDEAGADLVPLGLLGEGGMGQVRLARQRGLGREVAVKVVKPSLQSSYVADLLTVEGMITGRLEHPNIVPVYLLGRDERDQPIIVMKRVEGVPWSSLDGDDDHATLWSGDPLVRHLEVFLEVCKAVSFAHARGYVHRDIKPSNVMIGQFGEVYLLDWGIAARIGTGAYDHAPEGEPAMPLGTPVHMAPEMCATDGVIDERTDVYLLGATLHRVLTGLPRHGAADLPNVLMQASVSEPFPYAGEIPEELATICNRATAGDPEARYANAAALRDVVVDFMGHRDSIDLTHEAEGLLVAIESTLEPEGRPELRRLFTECRFAFMRALRQWPDNERAAAGLQRCLEIMVDVEIELGQLDAAEAWLDEMPTRDRRLAKVVAECRAQRSAEAEQVASLRKMAHEHDPRVSKGARVVVALGFGALVIGTAAVMSMQDPQFAFTPAGAMATGPSMLGLYAVVVVFLRRQLFATALNRRVIALVGIALVAMSLNHAIAVIAQPDFAYMIAIDVFVSAVAAAAAGATIARRFFLPAGVWLVTAFAIVLLPQWPLAPYTIGQLAGLLVLAWVFFQSARGQIAESSRPP
jgi:eukaryotic-like serine/threonine-protein kinase